MLIAFRNSKGILSRAVLLMLIIWGSASFFLFVTLPVVQWSVAAFGALAAVLTFFDLGEVFLLLFINFTNFYAFYGVLFTYNLHPAIVMVGLSLVCGASFFILGRKLIGEKNNPVLTLVFFVLFVLELYLTLTFWLINPLSRSFIATIFVYLFLGFLISIKGEIFNQKNFRLYLLVAVAILLILLFTTSWGR